MDRNKELKVHRLRLPGRSLCSIRSNRKWCKRRGSSLECQNCFFVYPIIDSNLKNLGDIKMVYNDLRSKLNEYNWDDGFEIPKQILAAPSCDLALALEIFYLSDGYAFLDDSTKITDLKEWGKFITVLYDDILNNKFPKTSTAFEIPLSQVQKYKLQKKGISKIFLTDL